MMNLSQLWALLRDYSLTLGAYGPVVLLVFLAVGFSILARRVLLPLAAKVLPVQSAAWDRQLNGLVSAIGAAVVAFIATPEALEAAILSAIAGFAVVALRNVNVWGPKLGRYFRDQLMGPPLAALLLLPFLGGCGDARHPERDQCYIDADSAAARAYLEECGDYLNTRECPHGDAVEERHGKALEACK